MSIDNQQIFNAIIENINTKYKKIINNDERMYLLSKFRLVNLDIFKNHKITDIIHTLTNVLYNELDKRPKPIENINMHDVFIQEIGNQPETALVVKRIGSNETINTLLQQPLVLQSVFNPIALHRKAYLILDRKYQSKESNNINEFKWNISDTSRPYDPLTSAVTTAPFRDIVKIKMFPFRFPNSGVTCLLSDLSSSTSSLRILTSFNNSAFVIPSKLIFSPIV